MNNVSIAKFSVGIARSSLGLLLGKQRKQRQWYTADSTSDLAFKDQPGQEDANYKNCSLCILSNDRKAESAEKQNLGDITVSSTFLGLPDTTGHVTILV